jgi:hypothetical protein
MKTPKAIGPIADRDCGYHFILKMLIQARFPSPGEPDAA